MASRVDGKMADIPAALHKKEQRQKKSCEFTGFWPGSPEHLVALITTKHSQSMSGIERRRDGGLRVRKTERGRAGVVKNVFLMRPVQRNYEENLL